MEPEGILRLDFPQRYHFHVTLETTVSYVIRLARTHQADLELTSLLTQPPECCVLERQVCVRSFQMVLMCACIQESLS